MTPKDVFDMGMRALEDMDGSLALRAWQKVHDMDLFFGQTTPDDGKVREITTHFDKPCQADGKLIKAGSKVLWRRGIGVYHLECKKEAEQGISFWRQSCSTSQKLV